MGECAQCGARLPRALPGRVVCWCTARRRASRRRIGLGVVGRRGPRGRSVIAEMVQGPHRERRTRARALAILTTWGDGEWAVVGRGLPGIAVAALRSPTSAAGCTYGAARGGRCASCGVRFGVRRPRPFVVGVSAWKAEQEQPSDGPAGRQPKRSPGLTSGGPLSRTQY